MFFCDHVNIQPLVKHFSGIYFCDVVVESSYFRAMLNLMKGNGHLVEIDRLLARSWIYLMTVDEFVECSSIFHVELLDILQLFTMKCPNDINYSTSTVSIKSSPEITIYVLTRTE